MERERGRGLGVRKRVGKRVGVRTGEVEVGVEGWPTRPVPVCTAIRTQPHSRPHPTRTSTHSTRTSTPPHSEDHLHKAFDKKLFAQKQISRQECEDGGAEGAGEALTVSDSQRLDGRM